MRIEENQKGVAISFGVFDGVHIGHQALIRRLLDRAKKFGIESVILTFDPHPALATKGQAPPSITTIEKKIELLKSYGIDRVIVKDFNKQFSQLLPEEFVRNILIGKLHAKNIVVGYDCAFGKDRTGDKWLLKELGNKYGILVDIVEPLELDGEVVSSTRLRNAIQQGNLETANKLLGRFYSISGIVVPGKGIGHKIGHATANIQTKNEVLPPSGVYAVKAVLANQTYDGVLNMGLQPTIGDGQFRIEVHLIDFKGTIYGSEIEILFIKGIREERKFATQRELIEQIEKDEIVAKEILKNLCIMYPKNWTNF
ncbi:MAG: bifunctional riboflavin kinase/FAD synthetase [Candidatus Poribacteria bacterium]